jgi:3,4-dihydroxy 2-butanone 4-phosphate synthase/GTP cyclohydrolase II
MNASNRAYLSPIESVIEEVRNGRMIILVDDEDRENEGDLIIPAQMATPEAINFMAKYGRGLVCLALTDDRVRHLGISLMTADNLSRHQTAFTVSIEARDGITTGISAPDRARTIAVAIDPNSIPGDIVSPGHVFPLVARDGGVLVRAGHTEASVDIARLAGLNPSAVICEVMNDDGTMARLPDLIEFADEHQLKIATIADLIAYRRRYDRIVERIAERRFVSRHGGDFHMVVYKNTVAYSEHLALIKGDIEKDGPILVRMHAMNVLNDVLGEDSPGGADLIDSMTAIGKEGRGVVVLIREPRATSVSDRVLAESGTAPDADRELRDYGVGAQILLDLGVRDMVLLTNSNRTVIGLEGYGLQIVDRRPIRGSS